MKATEFEDKWNAIFLSFFIPGSGQLWFGRWQSLIWFTLTALLGVCLKVVFPTASILSIICGLASFMTLGLLSAWNLKKNNRKRTGRFFK